MDTFAIFSMIALPVLTILTLFLVRELRREQRRSYLLYLVSEKLKDRSFDISKETLERSYNYTAEKLNTAIHSSYLDARKIIDTKTVKLK